MPKVILCLSIAFYCLAQSNSATPDLLLKKGLEEMSNGDTRSAEADFTAALSKSQSERDQAHEVSAGYDMYVLSEVEHKPATAEQWLLNTLESCRKPGSRVTTMSVLPYLRSFYDRHGLWIQDVKTLKSIVEFFLPDESANAVPLAVYSRLLGFALLKTHDYPEAEAAFRSALSLSYQFQSALMGDMAADERGLITALEKQGKKNQIKDLKVALLKKMKIGVEPPHLISKISPVMSELARRSNLTGEVILSADIVETGEVKNVKVVVPVGFDMDRRSAEAVQLWKFKPASRNGKPISATVTIAIQIGER